MAGTDLLRSERPSGSLNPPRKCRDSRSGKAAAIPPPPQCNHARSPLISAWSACACPAYADEASARASPAISANDARSIVVAAVTPALAPFFWNERKIDLNGDGALRFTGHQAGHRSVRGGLFDRYWRRSQGHGAWKIAVPLRASRVPDG